MRLIQIDMTNEQWFDLQEFQEKHIKEGETFGLICQGHLDRRQWDVALCNEKETEAIKAVIKLFPRQKTKK